jgi:hypothetical protein
MNLQYGALAHHFDALDKNQIWSRFPMQNQALEPGDEQALAVEKIVACTTLNPDWVDRLDRDVERCLAGQLMRTH